MNNALILENAISVNEIKEEECIDDVCVDDKINISETAIITGDLLCHQIKQYSISTALDNIKTELSLPDVQNDITNDKLKVEEGISTNDIKVQLNNGLLYCEEIKEEECIDDVFADDKINISETAVIIDNLVCDKIKQYNISTALDNIKTEVSFPEMQKHITHDNLKVDEGISTDDIKVELNNGLLYCEDCHVYYEGYCADCEMLVHILNRTVPIYADNKLTDELVHGVLEIHNYCGRSHIFAAKDIPAGVKFGPYIGLNRTELLWKIKGGKLAVKEDESKYLNWMQYIYPARNISEQNLFVFQYEHNLYYQSTRRIQKGDELLVYFGDQYEDSLSRNFEMDFIPTSEPFFKDAFACTFCCFGFSSKSYLAKHKSICPGNVDGGFSIEELVQCSTCKIHMDQKEYVINHMAYCCRINDRKCTLPTSANRTVKVNQHQLYKCQQCKYRTKYKGDLKNHASLHYEVKTYKCGICSRRFKTKEVLRLHVQNIHICAGGKEDLEHSSEVYVNPYIKAEHSCSLDELKQFKCSSCLFQTKHKISLKRHMEVKHLKEFNYKCDICVYKTNLKHLLKTHIRTKHLKEFQYKCDRCDYKTNFKYSLKSHIETRHLKEFKYKCDKCDYKANVKSWLNRHIKARHLKEFKYKCDTCGYKTNHKKQLQIHIDIKHLKEFKYKCDTCDYKANVKSYLKRHIEMKHSKNFKYKCDTCDYKTNWKSYLKTHIEIKHLKELKYNCDICDYKAEKIQLERHIQTRHLQEFKYKCDMCGYKANVKSYLKRHIESKHSKNLKYTCGTCEFKTNWKSYLKTHIEIKHLKELKYNCDICDYKANKKIQLERHVQTRHLQEFKYKCDTCGYKTNEKDNLKTHINTKHLKEFKYKCGTCDYKANQKSQLKIHIETKHMKEFKYNCDTCDYKTNMKSCLKTHIVTRHLKQFNYKCDWCDYKANLKSQLKTHVETKHLKVFKYNCDKCTYKTNKKSNLNVHKKRKHF